MKTLLILIGSATMAFGQATEMTPFAHWFKMQKAVPEDGNDTFFSRHINQPSVDVFNGTFFDTVAIGSGITLSTGHWVDDIVDGTWIPGQFNVGVTPAIQTAMDDVEDRMETAMGALEMTPGPTGPTGATGPKGDKGDTGATGAAGTAGANGTNGTNATTTATATTSTNGLLSAADKSKLDGVSTKRRETYSGTTNASGVVTVTFGTAFSVAPNIQANLINAADNQNLRITSITTTGFTVLARTRTDALGLLPTWANAPSLAVDILITEK